MRERGTAFLALAIASFGRIANRFWRAETGIFLAVWLGLMIVGRSQLFRDPGTLWHVVVGERILSSGRFVTTDPFSYTHAGQPWIARQWLAECAMALVHRVGRAGRAAAGHGHSAGRPLHLGGPSPDPGRHSLAAGDSADWPWPWAPARSTSIPGPTWSRSCCSAGRFALCATSSRARISLARLFWLVPLFLVWTNAHDGVLGGIATLGLTAVGWGLARVVGARGPIRQSRQLLRAGGPGRRSAA